MFQPTWKTGDWSNCTAVISGSNATIEDASEGSGEAADEANADSNGQCPGIMLRNVFCEQIVASGVASVVDDSLCQGVRPQPQKSCSDLEEDEEQDSAPKVSKFFVTNTSLHDMSLRNVFIESNLNMPW